MSTQKVTPPIPVREMGITDLAAMTRDQINALTSDDRRRRCQLLLADQTPVNLPGSAVILGRDSDAGVRKLRRNYLRNGGRPGRDAFVAPVNEPFCLMPDDDGDRTSKLPPVWAAGDVRRWGQQTGRLDGDLFPVPGGRGGRYAPPRSQELIAA